MDFNGITYSSTKMVVGKIKSIKAQANSKHEMHTDKERYLQNFTIIDSSFYASFGCY